MGDSCHISHDDFHRDDHKPISISLFFGGLIWAIWNLTSLDLDITMVSTMVDPVTVYRARFEDQLQTQGAPVVPEFGLELHWPATPFFAFRLTSEGGLIGAMIFLCQIQSRLQVTKKQQLQKKLDGCKSSRVGFHRIRSLSLL